MEQPTGPLDGGLSALSEDSDAKSPEVGTTPQGGRTVNDIWIWIGAVPALVILIAVVLAAVLSHVL